MTGGRPVSRRALVAIVAAVFAWVVVATTILSVGRYCLTTDGGNTRELRYPPRAAGGGG